MRSNILSKMSSFRAWDSPSNFKLYFRIYWAIFLGAAVYYFLRSSIIGLDTDLWYHLSGGRFFFETHSIPQKTFFSFLEPPREYVNYYWLFQVLVYKIYTLSGYYGLIFLRAALFVSLIFLVLRFLMEGRQENRHDFYLTIIFLLYSLFLIPRFLLVRPHDFTYFFIVAFLYLLELQRQRLFIVPLLAVLWVNLHGIEYHVLLLIVLSYLIETAVGYWRQRKEGKTLAFREVIPWLLSLVAVYLTPHGSKLLAVPLISTTFATQYINELQPTRWEDIFNLQINLWGATQPTIAHLLVLLAFITLASALWKKKIRLSHALLFAGGAYLFSMGARFRYEFLLLSLPLFRAHPLDLSFLKIRKGIGAVLMIGILAWPLWAMTQYFKNPPRYPFTTQQLPEGVVTFLNTIPAQGKVLNHPNVGGYLQWRLYPKYRILMDMQVPFVFRDEDFHLASQLWGNAEVLRKIISQFEPTFILTLIDFKEFKDVIHKFPQYKLVFFDHAGVLYLHEGHYPEIARGYEIRHIDPYEVLGKKIEEMTKEDSLNLFLGELSRMHTIAPEELMVNQLMALGYLKKGEFPKARSHAEAIIEGFPEAPTGYRLKGDALKGLKSIDDAIQSYEKALDRSEGVAKAETYKKIGYAYGEKADHQQTYRFLKKGIPVFGPHTPYQEVYDLALAAFLSGNYDEAHSLLLFASQKVPPEDREFQEKIREQLSQFIPRSAG